MNNIWLSHPPINAYIQEPLEIKMHLHINLNPQLKLEWSKHRECKTQTFMQICKDFGLSEIKLQDNSPAINDHACTSCGNDRCSKTEKSCWKCGATING